MREYACSECGLVFPIDRFYYVGTYRRKQCKTCFDAAKEDRKQAKKKGLIRPADLTPARPPKPKASHPWNRRL